MINFILKKWKIIFDILIVIALCVAFSYFDPFQMFRKTNLQQTANLLSNVQSIGELVTAEYFGEVITDESALIDDPANYSELAEQFNEDVKSIINELIDSNTTKLDIHVLDSLKKEYSDYSYLITQMLSAIYQRDNKSQRVKKTMSKFRSGNINWIEDKLLANINDILSSAKRKAKKKESIAMLIAVDFDKYESLYNELSNIKKEGTKTKDKIILIGRGTVKAGFNFGELNENNFIYNKSKKQIRLYGFHAQILDTIINPWFIPELNIAGYEFVNNPKNDNYQKVIEVKNKCRHLLSQQAIDAGIIQQAQVFGTQVLERFFVALTNEPELQIVFVELPYSKFLKRITSDNKISNSEAFEVANLLNNYKKAFPSEDGAEFDEIELQQKIIINQLKNCSFDNTNYRFNLFHMSYLDVCQSITNFEKDTAISIDSIEKFIAFNYKQMRDTIKLKQANKKRVYTTNFIEKQLFWYANNDTAFIRDFNQTVDLFNAKYKGKYALPGNKLKYPEWVFNKEIFDNVAFQDTLAINKILDAEFSNTQTPELDLIYEVERQKALDYVNAKPVKEFVYQINRILKSN